MLTLPLEPTDDRAHPVFRDEAACAAWLNQLQLTHLQQAHEKLLTELNELNRYPMRGLERLNILELLSITVAHVQEGLANKLQAKPLPLNESEQNIFNSVIQLWVAMGTAYQRCLQNCLSGDKSVLNQTALLCHRCLHYNGLEIIEYVRNSQECPARIWRQLHELYAYAEELHQVSAPHNEQLVNCTASYVKTLLYCYTNPAQLTRLQLHQLDHWLSLWSNAVIIKSRYHYSKNDARPLAVDLSGYRGLQSVEGLTHHDQIRYLTMVPLSKLLRVKTILLQQGQTSNAVGLGDHQDSRGCLELLSVLHQFWCENRHKRTCDRRATSLNTELCHNSYSIYAMLSGANFQQREYSVESTSHALPNAVKPEIWQIINESLMGACLSRNDGYGERLRCKQLVILRPDTKQGATLCATVWLKTSTLGTLQLGVRHFPGQPEAVRIRSYGINPVKQEAPAFFLPALPALKIPASLIIPRNWFKAKRVIEVIHEDNRVVIAQLGFSVEDGLDYERVSFNSLPGTDG
jgi:hypothetical protein